MAKAPQKDKYREALESGVPPQRRSLEVPKGRTLGPTTEALIREVLSRNEAARRSKVPLGGPFPSTRPAHPGKPHGPAETTRRRCIFCGYIVNNSERFTWDQKKQTFSVRFGGRRPGGAGIIDYKEISDPEYDKIMLAQLRRVAARYGLQLVPLMGPANRRKT